MNNKKDLIIAVLATFCLTAIIFMVIPIRSSTSSYDPWLDYNDDGKIGLPDLVQFANSYGTTGDPTKNVTVTNWQDTYEVQYLGRYNVSNYYAPRLQGFCGGYSRMTIHLSVLNYSGINWGPPIGGSVGSVTTHLYWYVSSDEAEQGLSGPYDVPFNVTLYQGEAIHYWTEYTVPIETQAPYFATRFSMQLDYPSSTSPWILFDVYVYLRNE